MHSVPIPFLCVAGCLLAAVSVGATAEEIDPAQLRPLGGHWYLRSGDKPTYIYRDADHWLDLFSYHAKDSNKDGIDNVRLSHDDKFLIADSQGFPNHPTAMFPNSGNPNRIRVQEFRFRLPLEPKLAGKITRLPMGPIGMALNGVVFFNPFEAGGMNAVEGYSEVWLDSCCGHPQQDGVYHYHKYPSCVKSPFVDDGKQHSSVIGFAFDGFPVYGPYESDGQLAKDLTGERSLDVCNGHEDPQRGYHYHVTPGRFPYVIGGYAGEPEPSNNRQLRRPEQGPIENNARGTSEIGRMIVAVRPGIGQRGKRHTLIFELAEGAAPPGLVPSWSQIGPYEAATIARAGNRVTAEIDVPADAAVGILLDCHLEFQMPGDRRPLVIKKNDVFRVVD